VRAAVRSIRFDPDPAVLPVSAVSFSTLARVTVGPADSEGEETVDVLVCTPEALAVRCTQQGIVSGEHLLVVDWERFDRRDVEAWLRRKIERIEADSWAAVGMALARVGQYEFDGYPT
jgi:hypothetical protein